MTRSLSLAVVASAALLAGGCGKAEFKPFNSADGQFSCDFPGSPKEQTQAAAGTTMKMFLVEERNGAYLAAYADFPIPANETAAQTERRLDDARDGMVRNVNATLKSETKIQLADKYPGREIVADIPSKSGAIRARVYLVGARLYQVMAVGNKAFADSASATRFLDSFILTQ